MGIGCIIALLILCGPRLMLIILHLSRGFMDPISTLWAILGWLFMPWTTLWCCYVYGQHGVFTGWNLVILIIAILADWGTNGSASHDRRHQER